MAMAGITIPYQGKPAPDVQIVDVNGAIKLKRLKLSRKLKIECYCVSCSVYDVFINLHGEFIIHYNLILGTWF